MEWTNDLVLSLIHEYRSHSVLWDSNAPHFKLKTKRDQAWEIVAEQLGTDVNEVKKKMNSVLASFRRERSKVLRSNGDFEEAYEPKWFAFDSFRFLLDRSIQKTTEDILEPIIENSYTIQPFDCANIKSEVEDRTDELEIQYTNVDEDNILQQETNVLNGERVHLESRRRKATKRKFQYEDPRVSNLSKIVRKLNNEHEKRDECKVFSEYLVFKLRNYDSRTRSIVQHLINNVIFNADIGKYSKVDNTGESSRGNSAGVSVLPDDKIVSHDIDYLQEISNIVADGKHFLDV